MTIQKPNKTFQVLTYISLLPLFFALGLAVLHQLNIDSIDSYTLAFSRINAYIYSHSYGALLLVFSTGMQLGLNLQTTNRWNIVFNFMLLWLAWISYHSFADFQGMLLLIGCWATSLVVEVRAQTPMSAPQKFVFFKIQIKIMVITLLSLITLINQ